jgi:hypothetical protein
MPKPNPLAQGLNQARTAAVPPQPAIISPSPVTALPRPAARMGRSLIGGHFATEVQRALKILAAEEGTTIQALLAEGINSVFARRGKPEIAELPTSRSV